MLAQLCAVDGLAAMSPSRRDTNLRINAAVGFLSNISLSGILNSSAPSLDFRAPKEGRGAKAREVLAG